MKIGQVSFVQMSEPAETPYGAGGARLQVPGPAGADAEPLLEELRTMRVAGHRRHRLRRAARGPAPCRRRARPCACSCATAGSSAERRRTRRRSQGDDDRCREPAAGRRGPGRGRPPRRDPRRQPRGVPARDGGGDARPRSPRARDAGVRRFVLMSALGTTEETKDLVPYYHAKWQMEQAVKASGLEHVIFRPSFVFGRGRRRARAVQRIAKLAPVTPIVGPGHAADPADLGRRRRGLLRGRRSTSPRRRTGRSSSAGRTVVTWNEFWSRLKQALGARRPSVHVPFGLMRVQAPCSSSSRSRP